MHHKGEHLDWNLNSITWPMTHYTENYDGIWLRCLERCWSCLEINAQRPSRWSLRWRDHCSQNIKSWILLAHSVQRLACLRLQMQGMSNCRRTRKKSNYSPQARYDLSPIPAMGPRCHRRYHSKLLTVAYVYTHGNWILHQMDQSHPTSEVKWRWGNIICWEIHYQQVWHPWRSHI